MSALQKILVVDDDPVVGQSFDRVLSHKGFAVITAHDAPVCGHGRVRRRPLGRTISPNMER